MTTAKKTALLQHLTAVVKAKTGVADWDPLELMAVATVDPDVDAAARFAAAKEVLKYTYPALRAVEMSGPDGTAAPVTLNVGTLSNEALRAILASRAAPASDASDNDQ